MKLSPCIFLVVALLFNMHHSFAQDKADTGEVHGVKIYSGKGFSDEEMSTIFGHKDSMNDEHIGEKYVPFDITTTVGQHFNNASCKGKVTVLFFWMVTAGYDHIPPINKIYDSLKNNPNFQLISVTDEGELVPDFLKQNDVHFPIAYVDREVEARRMNYGNGFPSYVILNKAGIVISVRHGISEIPSPYSTSIDKVYATINRLLSY